jgi:hypothetical protein
MGELRKPFPETGSMIRKDMISRVRRGNSDGQPQKLRVLRSTRAGALGNIASWVLPWPRHVLSFAFTGESDCLCYSIADQTFLPLACSRL